MIIVGIPPCKACKLLANKYPLIEYVELPMRAGEGHARALEVKRALTKLNVKYFPVVLNNDMTQVYPEKALEKI